MLYKLAMSPKFMRLLLTLMQFNQERFIIRPALKYPQYSDIAGTVSISPKVVRKSGMDDKMLLD